MSIAYLLTWSIYLNMVAHYPEARSLGGTYLLDLQTAGNQSRVYLSFVLVRVLAYDYQADADSFNSLIARYLCTSLIVY